MLSNLAVRWALGIAVVAVAGYLAISFAYPTFYYRFRLTLTVEDEGVLKKASSVIEIKVRTRRVGRPGPNMTSHYDRGIAPILGLGEKGTLIVALTGAKGHDVYASAIDFLDRSNYRFKGKGPFEVIDKYYPGFVWLPSGATHPKQAHITKPPFRWPQQLWGVRFLSLTVEPTDDAVVDRIEPAPEWLKVARARYGMAWSKPPPAFNFGQGMVETNWTVEQRLLEAERKKRYSK